MKRTSILCVLLIAVMVAPSGAQQTSSTTLTRARDLSVARTKSGFTLKGSLETTNGCMEALFVKSGDSYQAVQRRKPGLPSGVFCTQVDRFVRVSTSFQDFHPPAAVDVQARSFSLPLP